MSSRPRPAAASRAAPSPTVVSATRISGSPARLGATFDRPSWPVNRRATSRTSWTLEPLPVPRFSTVVAPPRSRWSSAARGARPGPQHGCSRGWPCRRGWGSRCRTPRAAAACRTGRSSARVRGSWVMATSSPILPSAEAPAALKSRRLTERIPAMVSNHGNVRSTISLVSPYGLSGWNGVVSSIGFWSGCRTPPPRTRRRTGRA